MISNRFRIAFALICGFLVFSASGCSVYMAANQPGEKDLSVLKVGTPRPAVIAELGSPKYSETTRRGKTDIFTFIQGYNAGERTGRAVLHGAADVFTLGLWEVIGTPIEGYASGTEISLQILYDGQDRVAKVEAFKGKEKIETRKPEKKTG